ncbi:hypothetical protein TBR22_A15390 [Luteitalea sp. TBR-22]|uniref:YciI family protein n=1 Tax=Luteitalea sp. TBR-22 TaxID=2802971 RepID=UPI001AF7F476|nr:YciI family protein [Luteitalea sp. TBR-22]BCS32329.1 hypothetical protein TBR22_A15390 [Luteitalea sp. TBR-22]
MKYMLMFYEPDTEFARRDGPEAPAYWGAWSAFLDTINGAGIVVSGAGLLPPATATTVRIREGHRHVQDGPFADTKEQLGGYFVIDVPSLDEALQWAARAPAAAVAAVEVRPVLPPMPR